MGATKSTWVVVFTPRKLASAVKIKHLVYQPSSVGNFRNLDKKKRSGEMVYCFKNILKVILECLWLIKG